MFNRYSNKLLKNSKKFPQFHLKHTFLGLFMFLKFGKLYDQKKIFESIQHINFE